ncbi:MAG: hypothetical protein RIA62_05485 [Cyclobacteriaceae bacterium]
MSRLSIIFIIWLAFCTACDPCENCGEPLIYEPTVELVIINKDTLKKLDTVLGLYTDSLDRNEDKEGWAQDELDSLEARLIVVNDSIENGNNSYQEEKEELEVLISDYLDSLVYYDTLLTQIDSVIDYLNIQKGQVNKGLLRVDTLFINDQYLTYEDSFETYDAPLLMNEESFTQFEIVIGNFRGEIAFDYDLEEFVDATREIKLRAFNIYPVNSFGFDSVGEPICVTDQCRDDETTVYLYFE